MTKKQRKNGHDRHTIGFLEAIYGALSEDRFSRADQAHEAYHSFRAKARAQRSSIESAADSITATFGSIRFAIAHIFWFGGWILINTGFFPDIPVFDPFPFGLLTMIVSLEAIFLSIFVLISQNSPCQDYQDDVKNNAKRGKWQKANVAVGARQHDFAIANAATRRTCFRDCRDIESNEKSAETKKVDGAEQ